MLRGARQVGKSSTVRNFAKQYDFYIEVNFEELKEIHKLFNGDLDPKRICDDLSVFFSTPVLPDKTLLFFDEIQACIPALKSLRFFYEKLSGIHIIAAGSLLEFALEELSGFGVGRIRSMFMYPFSFEEFLISVNEDILLRRLKEATPDNPLPAPIHMKLIRYFRQFSVIGGMPEVISTFVNEKDILKCQLVLNDLLISLKDDFAKYKQRVPSSRINEVFQSIANQSGGKFVYSKAIKDGNNLQIKDALDLLIKAGLVIPVTHTTANGLPIGGDIDIKKRKMLLFDSGIYQQLLRLNISDLLLGDDIAFVNKGATAEIMTGLEIIKSYNCHEQSALFYWHREATNSNAEIDYIIQIKDQLVPVEVKAGTKGAMQSMKIFLSEKKSKFGIRCSLENFGKYDSIQVYPLYAIRNIIEQCG